MKERTKEYCSGSPVSYWKVVNKKGETEAKFEHQIDADNFVIASGCAYLYEVLPVWED